MSLPAINPPKRQVNALLAMGMAFVTRPDGQPIVLREYVEAELGLKPKKHKKPEQKLNFDRLYDYER